jgi:hypothetical protein
MLKTSSIENEYYYGDLPGTLQYSKTKEELKNLELIPNDNNNGFYLVEHSEDNLKKCIPNWRFKCQGNSYG